MLLGLLVVTVLLWHCSGGGRGVYMGGSPGSHGVHPSPLHALNLKHKKKQIKTVYVCMKLTFCWLAYSNRCGMSQGSAL